MVQMGKDLTIMLYAQSFQILDLEMSFKVEMEVKKRL